MKKFLNKIKKRLHNTGSSLILVIVALAFIGILVGALLTAVAFSYRQKLYDYNARSNFYYLDQAMDEIYAGVGAKTIEALTDAYEKTREQIISFDLETETYKNDTDEVANKKFKDNFMGYFVGASGTSDFWKIAKPSDSDYKKTVVYAMTTMISNDSITLDSSKMSLDYIYLKDDGSTLTTDSPDNVLGPERLSKVVLKNVRLTRTSKYNRSTANGVFTQTISSDIEITRPDFNVSFDNLNVDMSTLFDYWVVADSGVDVDRIDGNILTMSGNIYAASDFYNKDYNETYAGKPLKTKTFKRTIGEDEIDYKVNPVSNYAYLSAADNDLQNKEHVTGDNAYNGKNDRSKYSGFYVDSGRINILADTMIVPGSISVMNGGNISVYGKNSVDVASADVWTDEVVLAGYSLPGLTADTGVGSSAYFNANMYVRDDTQIESNYSKLTFAGGYYGFSDSTTADNRSFIKTVAKGKASDSANIYQTEVLNSDGSLNKIENRGHYNSSSILINGENATLDLTETTDIFIAGRAYIELSRNKTGSSKKTVDANKGQTGATKDVEVTEKSYQYDASLDDYKTGESISVKSSQLAYYPGKASGTLEKDPSYNNTTRRGKGTFTFSNGSNGSILNSCKLFIKYFGAPTTEHGIIIPLTIQEVTVNPGTSAAKDKTFYYIDFEQVVRNLTQASDKSIISKNSTFTNMSFPTDYDSDVESDIAYWADMVKQAFIKDYCDYFNFCVNRNSDTKLDWMGYEPGYDDISMATARNSGFSLVDALGLLAFKSAYPETDDYILDDERTVIDQVAAELQNVTDYQDFKISKVELPNKNAVNKNINTSGTTTHTEKWLDEVISAGNNKYYVSTSVNKDNDSVIVSTLKGADVNNNNTNKTGTRIETRDFAQDYSKHYNYVKYALKDVYSGSDEAAFLDSMISDNGEGAITPINYYMNFDKIDDIALDTNLGGSATDRKGNINPTNLDLGQYKVWASEKDVVIDGGSGSTPAEITGIIVTKGDVRFKNVAQFNGLIICGGKVYITTSNTSLQSISSTKLCRNIIREVINKAVKYRKISSIPSDPLDPDYVDTSDPTFTKNQQDALTAIRFLRLFKAYSGIADKAFEGEYHKSGAKLDITNVDYSDVLRYNNWMRNVD